MKLLSNHLWTMLLLSGLMLSSCLDEDYYLNQIKNKYQHDWVKLFGTMDPNQDWSMAHHVTATFDLTHEAEGEQLVRIFTDHPLHKGCKLLAQTTINGTGTVSFDILKGSKDAYVRVTDADNHITFEGYFQIERDGMTVNSRTIGNRLLSRAINDGRSWQEDKKTAPVGTVKRDGNNEMDELYGTASGNIDLGNVHYFDHYNHSGHVTLEFANSFYPIIHDANNGNAIFEEGKDNRDISTDGVEYVTTGDTEITLTYAFGATGFYNCFGYFYWNPSAGQTYTNAHKIILMNDARPQNNLRYSTDGQKTWSEASTFASGSGLGNLILHGEDRYIENPTDEDKADAITPTHVVGTQYRLVYYGDDYSHEASYIFPEGTHIGFFIYTNYWEIGNTTDDDDNNNGRFAYDTSYSPLTASTDQYRKNIVYSIPAYNQEIKEYYNYRVNTNSEVVNTNRGEISAVTYRYHNQIILGFEDGTDKDMNDILLLVDANVQTNEGEIEDIEGLSWIIACEDLGSTGDYDFNDAVFLVTHIGGESKLTVTPLAAGGTLPLEVLYNDRNISDYANQGSIDFHKSINNSANALSSGLWKQINVDGGTVTPGNSITIQENVNPNYSINEIMNYFKVKVDKGYGNSIYITKNEYENTEDRVKAPQMIILPGSWNWPKEAVIITQGYPDFSNWNSNSDANLRWYTNPKAEHLVSYSNIESGGGGNTSDTPSEEEQYKPKTIEVRVKDVNGNTQTHTLSTYEHGTYHNEVIDLKASWFSNQGNTITVVLKDNSLPVSAGLGDNISLGNSDGGSLEGEVTYAEWQSAVIGDKIPFRFWCDASEVSYIEIKPTDYLIFDDYENGQKYAAWGNLENSTTGSASYHEIIDYEGSKVLHYHNDTDLGQGQAYLCEIVYTGLDGKITNGKTYMLSMRIKGSNYGSFSGGFRTSDSQGTGQLDVSVTTEWQTVMIPITCTGDGTVRMLFDLGRYAGDIWFDDLQLEELGTETTILTQDNHSGLSSWGNNSTRNNINLLTITNTNKNQANQYWQSQIEFQTGLTFRKGENYVLKMKIKGTEQGTISSLLQNGDIPASNRPTIDITGNDWQIIEKTLEFKSNEVTEANLLMFDIGNYKGDLEIERIQLTLPGGSTSIVNRQEVNWTIRQSQESPRVGNANPYLQIYNPSFTGIGDVQFRYRAANNFVKEQFYKLTLRIKGDNNGSIQTFLQRIVGEGNNAKYTDASEQKTITVSNGDYQTVTVYFKTKDMDMNGAKYLLFSIGTYVGNIYIDDLKLSTFTK